MVQVTFNGTTYTLTKNVQTGYYEIEVQAPSTGGIYNAEVEFTDLLGNVYTNQFIYVNNQTFPDTDKTMITI
jgi:hypothetical protein